MSEFQDMGNGAAAIIAATREQGTVDVITTEHPDQDGDVKFLVVPEGKTIQSIKDEIDKYRTAPERAKGTAAFTSLDSFIAHVNRTKTETSVIFADDDRRAPALLAVYDYNAPEADGGDPEFGEHKARYAFPLSDEWKAWAAIDGKAMTMEQFAEFLEDRIVDIMPPAEVESDRVKEFAVNLGINLAAPSQLMALSRGIKVNVERRVASTVNLQSGEGQISFVEEHNNPDGGPMRVPGGFAIKIPVFRMDADYEVPVRLRYRPTGGSVQWTCSLHRADLVFSHAVDFAAAKVQKATETPLFYGKPEQ